MLLKIVMLLFYQKVNKGQLYITVLEMQLLQILNTKKKHGNLLNS